VIPPFLKWAIPDKNPTDPIIVTSCNYPAQIATGVTNPYVNTPVMLQRRNLCIQSPSHNQSRRAIPALTNGISTIIF
jgi:hypothetical protein